MGIYAVTPGIPVYNIGSPLFEKVVLHLPGNKTFVIEARNNSAANKYIHSAKLNGMPLNKPWIMHEEIAKGGTLILEMSAQPDKKWGIQSPPPSMTR